MQNLRKRINDSNELHACIYDSSCENFLSQNGLISRNSAVNVIKVTALMVDYKTIVTKHHYAPINLFNIDETWESTLLWNLLKLFPNVVKRKQDKLNLLKGGKKGETVYQWCGHHSFHISKKEIQRKIVKWMDDRKPLIAINRKWMDEW